MKTGKASAARQRLLAWIVLLPVLLGLQATAFGATDQTIYDEALAPGWENWSWAANDLASTAQANTGVVSVGRHASALLSALSAFRRRAGRHQRLSEPHVLCSRWNHRRTDLPGAGDHRRHAPGRRARECARGGHVAEDHRAAELARRGEPHRREWLLVPAGIAGVDSPTFYIDTVVLESGVPPTPPPPVNGMAIYQDALVNGWNNWSWASVNTGSTANVHTGSSAIAVTADAFEALYLQHAAMPTDAFESLKFWIHGGATGGQTLNVVALQAVMSRNLRSRSARWPRQPGRSSSFRWPSSASRMPPTCRACGCRTIPAPRSRRSTSTTSTWNSRRRRAWSPSRSTRSSASARWTGACSE